MNALRITRLARIARPARLPTVSRTQVCRLFGSTALRRASEDGESFIATFKNTPMFNRFAEHPDALAALSKVAEFLKKNDIDMTGPPSSMTLFKLATNSEFRALTKNALEEMKKAGIEIKPEQAMEMFSQSPGPPKGSQ